MILKKLFISNFRVFEGDFEIEFPDPNCGRPFVVIFGENYHGKTTLLDAVRWALLGTTWTRSGTEIDRSRYVNFNQQKARVRLDFDSSGRKYMIERTIEVSGTGHSRRVVLDHVSLMRDNIELSQADIRHELNRIFPARLAGFSLFDGERLSQYEAELTDPSSTNHGRSIREDVENLLGLPALQATASDLAAMEREAEKRYSLRAAEKRREDAAADRCATLSEQIEELEQQHKRMAEEFDQSTARLNELDAEQRKTEEMRQLFTERDTHLENIRRNQKRYDELSGKRRDSIATVWKQTLSPLVERIISGFSERIDATKERQFTLRTLTEEQKRLEEMLAEKVCTTCGQPLPTTTDKRVSERLASVRGELVRISDLPGDGLQELQIDRTRLQAILPKTDEVAELKALEMEMASIRRERNRLNGLVSELNQQLSGNNDSEIRSLMLNYRAEQQAHVKLEDRLRRIEGELNLRREQMSALQKQMQKTNDSDRELKELAIVRCLRVIFDNAVKAERDNMRARLQGVASPTFVDLTGGTTSIWGGLIIDEKFVVHTLDKNQRYKQFESSAGEAQLVALSIVGALHTLAGDALDPQRPLLLDTPFGRLDSQMRLRVLELLPKWSGQVVLLVHSGEMTIDETRRHAGPKVHAYYSIQRAGTYASRLERCSEKKGAK